MVASGKPKMQVLVKDEDEEITAQKLAPKLTVLAASEWADPQNASSAPRELLLTLPEAFGNKERKPVKGGEHRRRDKQEMLNEDG